MVQMILDWMMKFELCLSMFGKKQKNARYSMAQRYTSCSSVRTFYIGDLVSLHIDAKYRKSTTPAKLFAKSFARRCRISTSYSVSMEYCPADIERQILNDFL